jgi:hypothetical protein
MAYAKDSSPQMEVYVTPIAPGRAERQLSADAQTETVPAIPFAMPRASSTGIGPRSVRSATVSPGTSSITRNIRAAGFLDAVDRCDVGMIQRCKDASLALESFRTLRIGRKGLGKELDRNAASEPGVPGLIYLAHAAGAQVTGDFVMREPGSDHGLTISRRSLSDGARPF